MTRAEKQAGTQALSGSTVTLIAFESLRATPEELPLAFTVMLNGPPTVADGLAEILRSAKGACSVIFFGARWSGTSSAVTPAGSPWTDSWVCDVNPFTE